MADEEWAVCPTCDAKVKAANLRKHLTRTHNDAELAQEYATRPPPRPTRSRGFWSGWKVGALAVTALLIVAGLAVAFPPFAPAGSPSGNAGGPSEPTVGTSVGRIAPDFSLTALDGPRFSLSQFRGDPVVLTFMAAWCGTCKYEANQIKQVYGEYAAKGVRFVSVDVDPSYDTESSLRSFRSGYAGGPDHIFAMDTPEKTVTSQYKASRYFTWIIDADGVITYTDRIVTSPETYAAQLDRLV